MLTLDRQNFIIKVVEGNSFKKRKSRLKTKMRLRQDVKKQIIPGTPNEMKEKLCSVE